MNAEARSTRGPQHMQALEQANAVRLARAELKRRVAGGELSAADVVLESPWEARSMTIADLLTSQCRWGSTRCRRFLQTVAMGEQKTIGSMTERQREALARQLRSQESRLRPQESRLRPQESRLRPQESRLRPKPHPEDAQGDPAAEPLDSALAIA